MVFYVASESSVKQLCFGNQIHVCLLLSPVESFLSFCNLFVACWGPTRMSLENWTLNVPSTGLGWAIGHRPRDSCLPWTALQRGPTTTSLTCSSCGTSPGSCRYGWARPAAPPAATDCPTTHNYLQRERSKGTLLCLFAMAARTNALLLGWAEFLKCWFQCFTPSASPEDTPNFVPKFRVVSVLYFSSAMMFLCDLLWIKYAFQVFIPASDILKLYIERNII